SSSGSPDEEKATDLARSIQTELRRLGCYRATVDGNWGKGSVRALTSYYRNTRRIASTTEPTVELLSDLFLQSGRVCKDPVVVQKAKPARISSDTAPERGKATGRKAARSSKPQSSRPAAPPPDISGGIGIGGVF
ncbi:MAG: caspase family protein, partial [Mesorhizobium sp.]